MSIADTTTYVVPNGGHMLPFQTDDQRSHFKGEMTMNLRYVSQFEIEHKQQQLREDMHRTGLHFSISGVRHRIGNTLIAVGTYVHGERKSQAEQTRVLQSAE